MPKLLIPVGIPGCGKSTFVLVLTNDNLRVCETDAIREQMVKDGLLTSVSDMSRNSEVFEQYHSKIRESLTEGRDVYADATNLRDFARKKLRDIAAEVGAETHAILFLNPSQAVIRNTKRHRVVPAEAMVNMLGQYEQMLKDIVSETYTTVTSIDSVG